MSTRTWTEYFQALFQLNEIVGLNPQQIIDRYGREKIQLVRILEPVKDLEGGLKSEGKMALWNLEQAIRQCPGEVVRMDCGLRKEEIAPGFYEFVRKKY